MSCYDVTIATVYTVRPLFTKNIITFYDMVVGLWTDGLGTIMQQVQVIWSSLF